MKMAIGLVLAGSFGIVLVQVFSVLFFDRLYERGPLVETIQPVSCADFIQGRSTKSVVLRVDDVQAWAWRDITIRMVDDAYERGIPLTLGVIPKGLGEDTQLIEYLQAHACHLEIAQHGYDHSNSRGDTGGEFEFLTEAAAKERIEMGLQEISVVTDEPVTTWIPPLNVQSTGTAAVLTELGFTHISTEGEGVFDYDASTFSYDTNELIATATVLDDCRVTFETSNHCIIMLHPQDFADDMALDSEKYQKYYLNLLDELIVAGYGFTTLNQL